MVFGALDTADGGQVVAGSATTGDGGVWASWKTRLGGGCAKAIDALLTHKELNTQQLAIATGLHRTTTPKLV